MSASVHSQGIAEGFYELKRGQGGINACRQESGGKKSAGGPGQAACAAHKGFFSSLLKQLGASDAVFYDGGGATAFAAGPRNGHRSILVRPTNAGEDLNPTHIVITACR